MLPTKLKIIGGLLLGSVFLTACPDPPSYPERPIIEFSSFTVDASDPNVAYLSIGFTDGDGDIGLTEGMVDPPFDTSSVYHFNMFAEYLTYNSATDSWDYVLVPGPGGTLDTVVWRFRVPYITPEGKNKALKGTIQVKLTDWAESPTDSIKYRIKLLDRAHNESVWIESPIIYNGVPIQ